MRLNHYIKDKYCRIRYRLSQKKCEDGFEGNRDFQKYSFEYAFPTTNNTHKIGV